MSTEPVGARFTTLTCRPARVEDLRAVTTLHIRSWQRAYRGLLPQHHLDSLNIEEAINRRARNWPDPGSHVAERHGRVVGWLAVGPYRGEDAPAGSGEIYALYVDPAFWSGGIGGGLLSYGLPLLAEQRLAPIFLWVLRENTRARRFYERRGFIADGAEVGYEAGGATVPEVRYRHSNRRDAASEAAS